MNSCKILELYKEINDFPEINITDLVEKRLDLLLDNYIEKVQDSFDTLREYDSLLLMREVSKHAKLS